jgi:glycerophosphoryl diester phosphodiesterase
MFPRTHFFYKDKTLLNIYLMVLMICFGCTNQNSTQVNIPNYSYPDCEFMAIGHRGYSDIYPENTLLSIEEAFKRGVKYCEIDVNVTSDDVYVLFHDQPTMYRTSNSTGYLVASTYKELLKLDVGSWKGSQFKNIKITTLEQALELAEKYDAYLYLDTKKVRIDLMAKALESTKVDPSRLLPAIANIKEAREFKSLCPQSSFVYFGGIPKNVNDDSWYKELIALGCAFFETYYIGAIDNSEDFKTYTRKVHEHGAKVWAFTSNNMDEINTMINNGVDGVESDIAATAMKVICDNQKLNAKPLKATTGNWNFEQKNLTSSGVGSQFRPLDYINKDSTQMVSFGTTKSFGIKNINNKEAAIAKIPAFNPNNGLFLFTNFIPDSNEELHFNYTLIMDLYIPENSKSSFISLLQTSPTNDNDGDFFINSGGLGINNEYHGNLQTETWYRIAVVVSKNTIKKYINGTFVGENSISSGRWSVYNVFPGGQDQGFLLFSDDNNETGELYINAVQLRNYSMSEEEIKNLGKPETKGIAIGNSGIYNLKFEGEKKSSIVNWDTNEIYAFLSKQKNLTDVTVDFDIPYGANSTTHSGSKLNFVENKSVTIEIVAQDGYSTTKWNILPVIN